MPFTAAHPAAVLPLRRLCPRTFAWSALLIGSLTPDLECFLALRPVARHGLTFAGSVYFCLPAGLLLWAVWHSVVKRPATLLLPEDWRTVVWPLADRPLPLDLRSLGAVAISILVASWLHQVWDAFTHAGYWGVATFPLLSTRVARFAGYDLTVFRLLQHGGSLVGIASLALVAFRWKRRAVRASAPELVGRLRVASISLILFAPLLPAALRALERAAPYRGLLYAKQLAAFGVITTISLGALLLLLAAIAVNLFWARLVTDSGSRPAILEVSTGRK